MAEVLTKCNKFAIVSTMIKNIIHTQDTFTIYHEGKPDLLANLNTKLERFIYVKAIPAWNNLNYQFEKPLS